MLVERCPRTTEEGEINYNQKKAARDENTDYKAGGFGVKTLPEDLVTMIGKIGAKNR